MQVLYYAPIFSTRKCYTVQHQYLVHIPCTNIHHVQASHRAMPIFNAHTTHQNSSRTISSALHKTNIKCAYRTPKSQCQYSTRILSTNIQCAPQVPHRATKIFNAHIAHQNSLHNASSTLCNTNI
jgi:hypothetical protein